MVEKSHFCHDWLVSEVLLRFARQCPMSNFCIHQHFKRIIKPSLNVIIQIRVRGIREMSKHWWQLRLGTLLKRGKTTKRLLFWTVVVQSYQTEHYWSRKVNFFLTLAVFKTFWNFRKIFLSEMSLGHQICYEHGVPRAE